MINSLRAHTRMVEDLLSKNGKRVDWAEVRSLHRVRIGFFQHERLIHLLVTLFFGLLFFVLVLAGLFFRIPGLFLLVPILLILLVAYMWHYFRLENGVQKLYRLDGEIEKRV